MLEKIRSQIAKKFGAKGGAIVEGNMAVIREASEATHRGRLFGAPEFADVAAKAAPKLSADRRDFRHRCAASSTTPRRPDFLDHEYYDEMVAAPFRDGTIAEAPVLPGSGMFMPSGTAAAEGQGPVPPQRAGVQPRSVHRLHGMRAGLPGRGHSRRRCTTSTNCC